MNFQWLGLTDYFEALSVQEQYKIRAQYLNQANVIGLEHPAVITLGKRAQRNNEILSTDKELSDLFIQVVKSDRGGQATLHSPGQLVIYPILPVKKWGLGVKQYVCLLQNTTQEFLQKFNIETKSAAGAGLETNEGKIAFVGIRIENGISKHGVSINISNDLNLFKLIKPCGMQQIKMDSFKQRQIKTSTKDAYYLWAEIFYKKTHQYHGFGTNSATLEN